MTETLQTTLEQIRLGEPQVYKNLCVIPLFHGPDEEPSYLSMKEALEQAFVEITEVSEGGSVPNLKVTNKSDLPVLLVDGEEMVGAKQNRIVNTTILLAANSETIIPVSCTEEGRWSYSSRSFSDSGVFMASKSRYMKSMRLHKNLEANERYDAEQGQVWNDIQNFHRKSGTTSATGAMKDAYIQRETDMSEYLKAFLLEEGQKGIVVFLNGKVLGADYISRHSAYKHLHEKLVKSHIIEAISEKGKEADPADMKIDAHNFLKSLLEAPTATRHQPAGLGEDYRYDSDEAAGAALVYADTIIHLTAFHKEAIKKKEDAPHNPDFWNLSDRMSRRFSGE